MLRKSDDRDDALTTDRARGTTPKSMLRREAFLQDNGMSPPREQSLSLVLKAARQGKILKAGSAR